MAPLSMYAMDANAAIVVSAVLTLAIGVSLIAAVIACGCCGGKKEEAPAGGDIYYSTDPNAGDFCPDCAAAQASGDQPTIIDAATQMNASRAGGPSLHRFPHKGGGGGGVESDGGKPGSPDKGKRNSPEGSQKEKSVPRGGGGKKGAPPVTFVKSEAPPAKAPNVYQSLTGGQVKSGKKGAPPPTETQMNKATENPNYQTLFGAKSDVFGKSGAKAPAGTNEATQMGTKSASNPNYQTLFGAKSDVFAAKDGKGGKTLVKPPEQSAGYRS